MDPTGDEHERNRAASVVTRCEKKYFALELDGEVVESYGFPFRVHLLRASGSTGVDDGCTNELEGRGFVDSGGAGGGAESGVEVFGGG